MFRLVAPDESLSSHTYQLTYGIRFTLSDTTFGDRPTIMVNRYFQYPHYQISVNKVFFSITNNNYT